MSGWNCEYVVDGTDTDGTTWHRCTVHNERAPSADAPCAGFAQEDASVSYLERLLAKTEELLWESAAAEPIPPSRENAVLHDTFDQMSWESLNETAKSVRSVTEDIAEHHGVPGERAFQDLFNLFYQSDPHMVGAKEMLPDFAAIHRIVQEFHDSDAVAKLRDHTRMDEYYAGFAILEMEQQFRDALERMQKAQEQQQAAEQQQQQAKQDLQDAQQEAQEAQGGDGEDDAAQKLQEAMDALQEANGQAQQAQAQADAVQEQVGQDMIHAAEGVQEEIEKTEDACRRYGLGPGQLERMSFDERRELTKKLHQGKLQKFAQLVGSWKVKARAMRRQRVKHEPGETYDFELGNDLARIVSSEQVAMAVPELEEQFWLRYAKRELLLRKPRGTARAGQGPILVLCDESYSMTTALDKDGNSREAWSKALSLALVEQARKEHRDFTYVGFDSNLCGEHHFPGGRIDLPKLIDFVEHFGGGGTDFVNPLRRAIELIRECEKRNQNKPDVVFITDGDGHIPNEYAEEFTALLRKLDAQCYAIQVGDDMKTGQANPKLSKLTDKVMFIERLNANPEGVAELFRNI